MEKEQKKDEGVHGTLHHAIRKKAAFPRDAGERVRKSRRSKPKEQAMAAKPQKTPLQIAGSNHTIMQKDAQSSPPRV